MRVCLSCIEHNAWSVFANHEKCFLCLPHGAPSHILNEAEEREYRRFARRMGWDGTNAPGEYPGDLIEALAGFGARIMAGGPD